MARHGRITKFWQSFTGRMIVGVLAIQIFLTPLLFYGILYFIERGFQSQFIDQVRNNIYLYAAAMHSSVEKGDFLEQILVLNEALFNEDLVWAEFIHPDGSVIRPDSDNRFAETSFIEDFKFDEHGDHVYYIASQLFNEIEGELLGTLRLGYNEIPTQKRINVAYRYGALLAIGYAVLSIFVAIIFGRRLIRPISQLQDMAQSIATGDTAAGLNVHTDILEISALAKDLDSMRQTLVDQHRDVRDREKRLHAVLDNAGEGIISINEKGVIESFNQAAESIFGYTARQVLGKNVSILIPLPHRKHHDSYIENYISTGIARILGISQRLQAQHEDGHLFPVNLTVTEIYLNQEHTFIGIVRDLTREEEKEKQLLQFWRIVEQSPISIVITDAGGTIEYVKPHFCRVTGYSSEDVFGMNSRILNSEHTQSDIFEELWTTISNGDIWRGVFQNRKKNGDLFWESATICPVHDHEQQITHYIALKEDITEHREKDRRLTQAMQLEVVGQMTDGIAHDFNNFLTIILGNLQFLMEDFSEDDSDDKMELVTDAMSAAYDGSNLVKQLLIFSRQKETVSKPMKIATFMERVQYLLKRAITEDIVMRLEVKEEIGTVLIDSNRLESAVLNLVINARDAMSGVGELVISIDKTMLREPEKVEGGQLPSGNYILISVADNGVGMTEDIRQRAVEPFFTTKPSASGTGLGLSMVNDLMINAGGGTRIESEPGKGTTVTLILPLCEQELAVEFSIEDQEVLDQLPGGKETVLLVEDQGDLRRFASRLLSRLGYSLAEAENAAEALECLQTNNEIELLFSDISMPGDMDGLELARYASSRNSTLKILLTTGMKTRAENGSKLYPDFPLLPKPYSAEKLAHSIRSVLDTGQLLL